MRSLITATILLCLVIGLLIGNTIYIDAITTEMMNLVETLPDTINPASQSIAFHTMDELFSLWNKNKTWISLSINYDYLQSFGNALLDTYNFYNTNANPQYAASRHIMMDALDRLHRIESIHLENIV